MSNKKTKLIKIILYSIALIIISGMIILSFSCHWVLNIWTGLTMEEVVYHLKAPLEGVGNGLIGKYVIQCIVPTLLCMIAIVIIGYVTKKHKKRFIIFGIVQFSIIVLFSMISVYRFWIKEYCRELPLQP